MKNSFTLLIKYVAAGVVLGIGFGAQLGYTISVFYPYEYTWPFMNNGLLIGGILGLIISIYKYSRHAEVPKRDDELLLNPNIHTANNSMEPKS